MDWNAEYVLRVSIQDCVHANNARNNKAKIRSFANSITSNVLSELPFIFIKE